MLHCTGDVRACSKKAHSKQFPSCCPYVNNRLNSLQVAHVTGSGAPAMGPACARQEPGVSIMDDQPAAGQLVTETFDYDGGRMVTAYIPPAPPEAVVFAGDGQLISQWSVDLEAADVPSTMIVGAHRLDDEMARLHEYSPGFDADRFAAHETFFVDEVRPWAESRLAWRSPPSAQPCSASQRVASSRSRSGFGTRISTERLQRVTRWGVPTARHNAEVDSARIPGSWHTGAVFPRERDPLGGRIARCGGDVVMTERVGSHGDSFWRKEFPLMVAWAFGP